MTTSELSCQKALFSIEPGHCWLNSGYMGPLPVAAQQAGMAAMSRRAFPIDIHAADFFDPAERVRPMLAALVGADAEHIAFVPSASYGTAIVAKNLIARDGDNVVMLGEQFPSNVYPWREWRAAGVEMRSVPAPDLPLSCADAGASRAAQWNQAVIDAIDERTMLVAIEQAHWTDGSLFDLVRIGARCKQVDAVFLVDATQSAGAMPIDVQAAQIDALVVHCYKSMLCNYGLGFVALSDRFAHGSPLEQSWLMRAGSEDFAHLVDYQDAYAPGMRRFDSSLRVNPLLISMLEVNCRLLLDWQPARIRDYLLRIETGFAERITAAGFEIAAPADRAANIFGVRLPAGLAAETVRAELAAQQIHVSVRGASVRVSPHVFNDVSDLARLAAALEAMIAPRGGAAA